MRKRAILNFTTSFFYQISVLIVGLILPKYYTEIFGSSYNGLNQSIAQVLGMLAILQYGIAASSIQAMFKPIASGDEKTISAIYRLTELQYRKMGYIFLLAILPIIILYPYAIKDQISYGIVVVFILLRAISSAMEYFFQAKYNIILIANNRSYAIYFVNILLQIISLVLHLLVLFTLKDIIIYQSVAVIVTMIRFLIVSCYIKKHFPYLYAYSDKELSESKFEISQRSDVMISEVAGLVINSAPLVILSTLSTLVYASIYSIYSFVIVGLQGFLGSAREAVIASMGRIYYTDKEQFNRNMDRFESLYFSIMLVLFSTAIIVFTPFIRLYTSKMDSDYALPGLSILFVCMAIIVGLRIPSIVAINTAGHFKQVKYYAVIEAIINIALSICLTIKYNIYGVLIAAIVAGLYRTPILIYYAYRKIYQIPIRGFMKKLIFGTVFFIIAYVGSLYLNITPNDLLEWFALALLIFLIVLVSLIILLFILDRPLIDYIFSIVKR